jgi:mannosyltransferase
MRTAVRAGLVGVLAAAVAGRDVAVPGVWRDEAASITAAQRDWTALGGLVAHIDAVHALSYAVLHVWFDLVGYSPLSLRLPSVVATGIGAALVVLLGTRLAGRRAGLASGLVAAVLPTLVWAGGEGRSYAWTATLATSSTLALLHALGPRPSRRARIAAWAGYTALLALGAVLFVDSVLLGVAHLVAVLVLGRSRVAGVVSVLAATVLASPVVVLALQQAGQLSWIARFGAPTGWELPAQQWFRSDAVAIAAAAVLVAGVLAGILRRRAPGRALAVLLPWALLPPAALLAIGLVHAPVYWPRYVTFTVPAVALLLGVAAAALPRPLTAVAVLVVAVLAVPQIAFDRSTDAKTDAAVRDGAALVARERSVADGASGILFTPYLDVPRATTRLDAIAYPAAFRGLVDLRAVVPLERSTELFGTDRSLTDAAARAGRLRTVWVLLTTTADAPVAQLEALGFRPTGRFTTTGTTLLRFTR